MKMQTRLQKLTDETFLNLANRVFHSIDKLMNRSCEGGLSFGWDYATFNVLFERKAAIWRQIIKEAKVRSHRQSLVA